MEALVGLGAEEDVDWAAVERGHNREQFLRALMTQVAFAIGVICALWKVIGYQRAGAAAAGGGKEEQQTPKSPRPKDPACTADPTPGATAPEGSTKAGATDAKAEKASEEAPAADSDTPAAAASSSSSPAKPSKKKTRKAD